MRIWIDLATTPQVVFFAPIVRRLKELGHETLVTIQDYGQAVSLARKLGVAGVTAGRHGGPKRSRMAWASLKRVGTLIQWAKHQVRLDLAVSHNSYTQLMAARVLGIRSVTLMDYEYQPMNHLTFRLAGRVGVPECFPLEMIRRCGAKGKYFTYPGFKEQVYLSDWCCRKESPEEIPIPKGAVTVLMRPPAGWTLYHVGKESELFWEVLRRLGGRGDVFVIFLPRVREQKEEVGRLGYKNVWVPEQALEGSTLLSAADLVISGGGTMNREAALLGIPTYSVFAGKMPAVDLALIRMGRMTPIREMEQIKSIRLEKRSSLSPLVNDSLACTLTDMILRA
jgi:predicted glycosyltransferase